MPRYEIKVTHEPKIEAPKFTAEQMESFGRYSVQVMRERLALAIDVFDRPAKPLQPKYKKRKESKGLPGVRDLRLTGNMLGSIHVKDADSTHVTVKVEGATPFRKGIFNQNIDPWFGLSNNDDQRVLKEKVQPVFAQNIKDILS